MGNYLAFDLGASSGRAIIGSITGGKLKLQEVHRFGNGSVEKNGSLFWDYSALQQELLTGLEKALAFGVKLDGISIDTWGVDYLFFDRDTKAVRRDPYNYRDRRSAAAAPAVWQKVDKQELYRRTGIQCMTLNTVYQLYAHFQEHPEDFENSFFLPIPDALATTLGGEYRAEYTFCSTTNMLDPVKQCWDWELIDRLGLPREVFPEIVPPCSCNGRLKPELCKKFNCEPIPIFKCGSHDTASAVLAVPAPEKGSWAYLSAGTWALLGAELAGPRRDEISEKENITNEGGVGNTIRFLTNIMGSWLFQELRRVWNSEGRNYSFNDIEQMARASGSCKYFIDPNCAEFAAPGNMPENIRKFCSRTGQCRSMSDGEVIRAVYDSLALYFRCKLEMLERLLGTRYSCLNIVGGGTKDRFLMQLTADALNRKVIAGPVEATAAGNILAQAIANGEAADVASARNIIRNSFELQEFEPEASSAERYDSAVAGFRKLLDGKQI